jgi:RNA polymerase sigma factor (sigma-70 family)
MNDHTTRRMARIRGGAAAVDELFALVYDELRGMARAQKRGGKGERLSLDEIESSLAGTDPSEARDEALPALDASLERLALESERQSRIVESRFFGGMTIEETAKVIGVSPATVKRAWTAAQAWLYRDLRAALGETGA